MNTIAKFFTLAAVAAVLASCEKAEINTVINEDGSCTREFVVDPESSSERKMVYEKLGLENCFSSQEGWVDLRRSQDYASVNEMCADWSSHTPLLASLSSEGKLAKTFKWFYTYYTFSETFHIPDTIACFRCPFSEEEASFWATGKPNIIEGECGFLAAEILSDLKRKDDRWLNTCIFNMLLDVVERHYDELDNPKVSLEEFHAKRKDILVMFEASNYEFDAIGKYLQSYFEDDMFRKALDWERPEYPIVSEMHEVVEKAELLGRREYTYSLRMPGKIIDFNTGSCEDNVFKCWVGVGRMAPDMRIVVISRKANIWAFVLAGLVLVAAVASFFVRRR